MRKCLFVLTFIASAAAAPNVYAQSATATIDISATVKKNCLISTTPVAYGAYDPVGANATTPLDATGGVLLTCTKGTNASIALDKGKNASGTTRQMTDGASGLLTYELYQDNSHSNVWNDTTGGMLQAGTAPSKATRTFPVYGRVSAGQDVPVGSFSDSVVATVNF